MLSLRKVWQLLKLSLLCLLLQACASHQDDLKVYVVGFEPMLGEAFESRFLVKLRVQNPSDQTIKFTGVVLNMETNGEPLASGVSGQGGDIPRFSETLVSVPMSVSALNAIKQAVGLLDSRSWNGIPYVLKGRLVSENAVDTRFSEKGQFSLTGLAQ